MSSLATLILFTILSLLLQDFHRERGKKKSKNVKEKDGKEGR